jgi:putative DNA primase/helicase
MPEVAPPVWDNIPPALAALQQWLLWKFEPPEKEAKKWRKVPYYVAGGRRTGDQGSDRDRQRLATMEIARRAFDKGGWHGVGFAFLPDDGLIGIDIDGAIDQGTGEVSQRCLGIIGACNTFTEYSPSGGGVHIIGYGKTGNAKSNDIGVEMFCGSQYFTVTGRPWPNAPKELQPITGFAIDGLHAMVVTAKEAHRAAAAKAKAPAGPAPQKPPRRAGEESPEDLRTRVQSALDFLSPDLDYQDWISIGWALRDAFDEAGFGMWDRWSAGGSTYPGEGKLRAKWTSFTRSSKPAGEVVAVIFKRAIDAGWKSPPPPGRAPKPPRKNDSAPAGGAVGGDGAGASGPPPPPPPDDVPPAGPDDDDEALELFEHRGRPVDCRENVLYCLRHDPALKTLAKLNTFTELHERTRDTPWGRPPGEWDEEDDLMLGEYLARTRNLLVKASTTLRNGVLMAAREHKFNPIRDLIKSVEWDGTPRLDHWLTDTFEVQERPYTQLIGRCFIMGMVMRALRPGCKFDYMLILKGEQGLSKSGAFRVLAEPWFTDNAIKVGDKDSTMAMQLVWLAESAELESLNKAETTLVKQFLSAQEDMYRPPYGAQIKKRPRHTVMGGTTNADTFLKDATGDRRFWPLEVEAVNLDVLRNMRLQLFAEALHRLRAKEQYWPTRQQEKELVFPEQERFKKEERWEDYIDAYVNAQLNDSRDTAMDLPRCHRDFFTSVEIYDKALNIKADRIDGAGQMDNRISNAMKALGFVKHRETTGIRRRGWLRKPPEKPDLSGTSLAPTVSPQAQLPASSEPDDDLPL